MILVASYRVVFLHMWQGMGIHWFRKLVKLPVTLVTW